MSGKAALAAVAIFVSVWAAFFKLVTNVEGLLLDVLIFLTIFVSFAASMVCAAYIDTRRQDE